MVSMIKGRKLSARNKFLLVVGIPTLVAAFFYMFWATDMYVSEAQFAIRSSAGQGGSDLLAFFGKGGGATVSDSYVVKEYIRSPDMLKKLDKKLNIGQHYSNPGADFISRLPDNSTSEEFLDYYRNIVHVIYDSSSGIFTLKVRAYSTVMAQNAAQVILDMSEQLVNRMRDRALEDSRSLAMKELQMAEQRVGASREAFRRFRADSDLLNPEASASALVGLITTLEAQVVQTRTELAEARSYMREDSVQVTALVARISAIKGQISAEKTRLTGTEQRLLNDVIADFERLKVEREFAEKRYLSALASLEAARVRAESKSLYLVAFAVPTLPEESMWPRRSYFVFLTFAISVLVLGIFSLLTAAIREHVGI